jgi:hypothetical protein
MFQIDRLFAIATKKPSLNSRLQPAASAPSSQGSQFFPILWLKKLG